MLRALSKTVGENFHPPVCVPYHHQKAVFLQASSEKRRGKKKGKVRPRLVSKNFQNSPSHRMFGYMYRVLNIDEKN
jgi:hypothetical protein